MDILHAHSYQVSLWMTHVITHIQDFATNQGKIQHENDMESCCSKAYFCVKDERFELQLKFPFDHDSEYQDFSCISTYK